MVFLNVFVDGIPQTIPIHPNQISHFYINSKEEVPVEKGVYKPMLALGNGSHSIEFQLAGDIVAKPTDGLYCTETQLSLARTLIYEAVEAVDEAMNSTDFKTLIDSQNFVQDGRMIVGE
jgi:hypothetical protein